MSAPRKAKLASFRVPITINAAKEDEEGPRSFESIAYSGGLIPGYTATPRFDLDYVIDLAGMAVAKNAKVNLDHEATQRVGHETVVENTGEQLIVKGLLSAETEHRDLVLKSAKNKYPWEASQEASLSKIRKLAAGKTALVNGQTFTGPIYIVGNSMHDGLAFVSTGADEGNSVSVAATAAGDLTMSDFDKWLVANEFDPDGMTDKQKVKMQAAYDAEQGGGTQVLTRPSKISELKALEQQDAEREEIITRMTHTAIKEHRHNPQAMDAIANMGAKAIQDKTDPDKFELDLLRGTRIQAGAFKTTNRSEPDARVMEAALCRAAGLPGYEKHYSEQVLDAVERDPRMRSFSLQQMLMRAACSNGYDGQPGERITNSNIRRVLKFAFPDEDGPGSRTMMATQFSTVSLPGIFATVANKELLAGHKEEDSTWREISRIATSTDFKVTTAYRLTDSLEYEELPKGGEIKHGTLGEETYTRQLKTYAKMLGLDRQDIINDDLSAFDDLRTILGRGSARKFNNVFWTGMMNNASFYTTLRGNYIEGSTTNLGTDGVGLTAGVAAFKKMESVDGKRIGGQPTILMVPPELEFIADRLWTGGGAQYQTVANTNPFINKYRPVVVPWLSDSDFSGNSTTAWYLFRSPSILAPMVVSFLNGNQTPVVESTDADFENLGILFRGYHDWGVSQAEYLAGLKSKGAT